MLNRRVLNYKSAKKNCEKEKKKFAGNVTHHIFAIRSKKTLVLQIKALEKSGKKS